MRSSLLSLFCFLSVALFSQAQVNISIKVLKKNQSPFGNALVAFHETSTGEKIEKRCNSLGEAKFALNQGNLWKLFIEGSDMHREVEIPKSGEVFRSMTVTYNPELDKKLSAQSTDRSGLTAVSQSYTRSSAPEEGKSILKVMVVSRDGKKFKDQEVHLINLKKKQLIKSTSDITGIAYFMVEPGEHYDVDVEGALNVAFVDVRKRPGMLITIKAFYEEAKINEQVFGDTIVQIVTSDKPVSGRAMYTIAVEKVDIGKVANETVYLAEIHGTKVYVSHTDNNGEARFLLPLGKKYMVHFDFQKDVDAIDLSRTSGFVQGRTELTYRPDPRLEHPELYIPNREQLFLINFENFLLKQYPKPKKPSKLGVYLKWANKINAKSKEALLEIGYTASSQGSRLPCNISFVIDNSGSMAGYYRIEKLKEAMKELMDELGPKDKISIVTFESEMKVAFAHQRLGADKEKIKSAIDSIEAKGGTNMLKALEKAYEFVDENYIPNGNNIVIVLSDGYDENSAEQLMNVQKPYGDKIDCSTVGVGMDYNHSLLTLLAGNGKGTHVFIGESGDFLTVFKKELNSLFAPAIRNVKLEIIYNDRLVFKHLYGKEPFSHSKGKSVYQIPNLYEGSNDIALAKFDLIKPNKDIESKAVTIRFTYVDDATGKEVSEEYKTYPEWEDYTGKYEIAVEFEIKKMYAVAEINRALKIMSEKYADGDAAGAQKVLQEVRTNMQNIFPDTDDKDLNGLFQSMDLYLTAFKNLARKQNIGKGIK